MKIAIVILNWNGRDLLEKFLPSVVSYSQDDAEIYIADNNSSDDSINFLNKNYPKVKIIKNEINGGFAKGYNDALKRVDADIYALVNSDIEVTENWLKPIIKAFKEDSSTAVIQPKYWIIKTSPNLNTPEQRVDMLILWDTRLVGEGFL